MSSPQVDLDHQAGGVMPPVSDDYATQNPHRETLADKLPAVCCGLEAGPAGSLQIARKASWPSTPISYTLADIRFPS